MSLAEESKKDVAGLRALLISVTPYKCNWWGYNCRFCRISDDVNTAEIEAYCESKAHKAFTYNGGPRHVGFAMRSWNLANCQ